MKTFREKLTFVVTLFVYLLFHLGKAPETGSILTGTAVALLNTLPYEIGLTYLILVFIRRNSGGEWPPWDRILRLFFTVGIIFGLIYNLYVRGIREQERLEQQQVSAVRSWEHNSRKIPSYWA